MKTSSITEWKTGDKGLTKWGDIVTIEKICGDRMVKIVENLERKLYIPAHGEIEKIN